MRSLLVTTLTLIALAATGCGDDSGDTEAKSTPSVPAKAPTSEAATETPSAAPAESPEQALETAYRVYIDAFLSGDGATTYSLMAKKCQDQQPLSEVAEMVETAADIYGKVDYTIDSIDINGDSGKVNATYPVEALNQGGGSEWTLENGAWRMSGC